MTDDMIAVNDTYDAEYDYKTLYYTAVSKLTDITAMNKLTDITATITKLLLELEEIYLVQTDPEAA